MFYYDFELDPCRLFAGLELFVIFAYHLYCFTDPCLIFLLIKLPRCIFDGHLENN